MKTIGLLGGTGWSSTIEYYTKLNQLVAKKLGGYHSAKILLKSLDYHDIMISYGENHDLIANILKKELKELINLNVDCIIICCNSLHKYYDMIKQELNPNIPVMHAVELVAQYLKEKGLEKVLLLATKVTMEDGFFADILEKKGIAVSIPTQEERHEIQHIHSELMHNTVKPRSREYFSNLIDRYKTLDAVILGCTEYPLAIDSTNSILPIINPVDLQVEAAVHYSLQDRLNSGCTVLGNLNQNRYVLLRSNSSSSSDSTSSCFGSGNNG